MLTALLRALRGDGMSGSCQHYDLGNASGVVLWLATVRRIGDSMDRLAKSLR